MRPSRKAHPQYVAAFSEIAGRIAGSLTSLPARQLPIKMYVAGGAALHFYLGERVSRDIDAAFSHRIALPENLEVNFRDSDGRARLLYFDRQYSDTFGGLLHEDAYEDSVLLELKGLDRSVLEVRLLSALDLAVSKIARFESQDRADIEALASCKLFTSTALRRRAEAALRGYVGDLGRIRTSIEIAVDLVKTAEPQGRKSI
jgi:hypothetical protein